MPRIQEYRQQSRGGVSAPTGQMQASGVSGLAESLKIIGKTVNNITDEYDRVQEKNAIYNVEKATVAEQTELTDYYNKKKDSIAKDGKGFTESVIKDLEERKSAKLDAIESPRERELLSMRFDKIHQNIIQDSMGYERDTGANYEVESFQQTFETRDNQVRANPALADRYEAENDALIDASIYLPANAKTKLKDSVKKSMFGSAIDGSITALEQNSNTGSGQINAMMSELKNEKWQSRLNKGDYDRALSRLGSMKTTLQVRDQIAFTDGFQSSMDKIRSTGIDDGKFTAQDIMNSGLPEKKKQDMLEVEKKSRMIGVEVAKMRNAPIDDVLKSISYDQVQAELKNAKPEEFSVIQDSIAARTAAAKERMAIYKKDPVRYTLAASSVVATKHQTMLANPSPENVQEYASTLKSEQMRLDPYSAPKLLMAEDINRTKYMMDSATPDNAGARDKLNTLKTLNMTWGKYYPEVIRDLRQGKALTSVEFVAANVGADDNRIAMAEDLIKASQITDDTYKKTLPVGKTKDDISKNVRLSLEPLRESLAYSVDGADVYSDYVESGEKLAMYYASKGRQVNEQQIVRDMILKDYEFSNGYRIPKAKVNDIDAVKTGARNILMDIDYLDLAPLRSQKGIKENDTVSYYKNRLNAHGKLVNDSDNGLRLVDELGYQVYGVKDGKKTELKWTWQEIQNRTPIRPTKVKQNYMGAKI